MAKTEDSTVHGEGVIIREFFAPLAAGYPGALDLQDDCATILPPPGSEIVVKTDPVRSGVHFFPDEAPEDIGWKALAVNISDLAAKGAVPIGYLLALSFPEPPQRDWLARFTAGLAEAQTAFACHLIGGDTDRAEGPLSIAVTVFGHVPAGRMVRRAMARTGDLIFVTGTLGDAALGLELRYAKKCPLLASGEGRSAYLLRRYLRPEPRLGLRAALRGHASAAMDLSDGLAKDLGRMCRASGVGAEISLGQLPLSAAAADVLKDRDDRWRVCAGSGDDYELLVAIPPGERAGFLAQATAAGVPVTEIGRFTGDGQVRFIDPAGADVALADRGWDHF